MSVMDDDFIESIIRAEPKEDNPVMIYRTFYGMESVAQFEKQAPTVAYNNNGGDE